MPKNQQKVGMSKKIVKMTTKKKEEKTTKKKFDNFLNFEKKKKKTHERPKNDEIMKNVIKGCKIALKKINPKNFVSKKVPEIANKNKTLKKFQKQKKNFKNIFFFC